MKLFNCMQITCIMNSYLKLWLFTKDYIISYLKPYLCKLVGKKLKLNKELLQKMYFLVNWNHMIA